MYRLFTYKSAWQFRLQKTFYMKRYIFILQGLYSFWMYHLRPIISHFNNLIITKCGNKFCITKFLWVSIHYAFNIFPYSKCTGVKHIGKNGGGIITSFTTKRSTF